MGKGPCSITQYDNCTKKEDIWPPVIMEGDDDHDHGSTGNDDRMYHDDSTSSSSSSTSISNRSSLTSSSDLVDDASSSSSSSSSHSRGSLHDFSDLMTQLPIKRGLSKYFEGKSQSFTSFSKVGSIEDLAKRDSCSSNQRKALKASKSYAGGLGAYTPYTLIPKPTISKIKKNSSSSSFPSRSRGSSFGVNTLPPVSVRSKKF